jgi:hypothetical protein
MTLPPLTPLQAIHLLAALEGIAQEIFATYGGAIDDYYRNPPREDDVYRPDDRNDGPQDLDL